MDFLKATDEELVKTGHDGRATAEIERRLKNEMARASQQGAALAEVMEDLTRKLVRLTSVLVRITWALVFFALVTIGITVWAATQ